MSRINKTLRSKTFYALILAVITFLLTRIGMFNPHFIETYYSNGMYPIIAKVLSFFSNWVLFSLDDLFYAGLITLLIISVFSLLFRKIRLKSFIKLIIATVAAIYSSFYLFWGFNYYREDINQRLDLPDAKPDVEELMSVFEWLVEETNKSYTPIYTIDKGEIQQSVQEAYLKEAYFLKIDTSLLAIQPKEISLSRFFAAATISGYYGPFFSEVHINQYLLPMDYPMVFAHEMAHRLGITSEAEANFYAWLVGTQSNDKQLVYSANLYLLHYFVYATYKYPQFKDIVRGIRYEVRFDYYKSNYHWLALMDADIEMVATKMNDAYLKTNNIEEGIEDYEGVIKFVMDYKMNFE